MKFILIPEHVTKEELEETGRPQRMAFLLHEIRRLHLHSKYHDNKWIPLDSQILRRIICEEYKKFLDHAIEKGWIERKSDKFYPGYEGQSGTCKKYRMPSAFLENTRPYFIRDKRYANRLEKKYNRLRRYQEDPYKTLQDYVERIRIRAKQARTKISLMDLPEQQHYIYRALVREIEGLPEETETIENIRNKAHWFKVSDTNNRVQSSISNLKSELRQFLYFPNHESLTIADLNASQALFLARAYLLDQPGDEPSSGFFLPYVSYSSNLTQTQILLKEAVEGRFYEEISTVMEDRMETLDREAVKERWFQTLYSHPDMKAPFKMRFAKAYPNLYEFILKEKDEDHRDLAIRLQREEAEVMIEGVSQRLIDEYDWPFVTLHDGLMVPSDRISEVTDVLDRVFENEVGFPPPYSIEELN